MTWNDTTRPQYERKSDRYASDLTDDEWALIEPFMPPPRAYGPSAQMAATRDRQRHFIHRFERLPVGNVGEGFSASLDGPLLVLQVAR